MARVTACLALALVATTAAAQSPTGGPRSNTRGILLSASLSGNSFDSDELVDDTKSGGGFGAQLGWGFTPLFSLVAGAGGARIDVEDTDFVLVHFDLLARFNFRSGAHAFVPYVEGGVSARIAGQDDAIVSDGAGTRTVDLELSGGAFTLGGGFHYFVSPIVALGAGLQLSSGEFSTVKFDNVSRDGFEFDATSTRLNVALTLYPMLGRH
jgi:outer membrane protein with beta-barrel domain